jgi:hypothetical protein
MELYVGGVPLAKQEKFGWVVRMRLFNNWFNCFFF